MMIFKFKEKCVYASVAVASFLMITEATAQSQYGWRGPNRDGIYPESGLLKTWPAEGPQLAWETEDAGKGYSSPVIVGDRLYLTGMNEDEDKEIFSAYTLDGKKIYEVVYGSPWKDSYPETRTTPAIVGDKAYVISGNGEVVCLRTANGDIVWTVDGNTSFGRKTGTWGTSECPLVFDNKVIFCPGGEQTAMVALNAETGETVWKSPSLNDISNYASPLLITHNGKRQIVALSGKAVIGVDPDNGRIAWTFDDWGQSATAQGWEKISPNMPLYKDGRIFSCNGYDMNSFLLELNDDATAVKLVWRNDDLDTHVGGFVLVDGTIYGSNWINNGQGNWLAVDWKTGKTLYDTAWGGGKSKGSIIAADGMLYCYDERRGAVGLVNPTPEKFDVVSEFRITKGEGPHWAHPVVHNGILYIRHGNALMAYKVK
ncbi:PQQ-binding-like beta-propeller repeat protein [Parabacteroides sp. PF5-6]|uniref:outer membrane protein assembly factor BamB family protein n=1 Tax=Parabacteroides sp. PF5-6 TaxID=1742403 RepID=UPI002405730F|nr:PQQ-binding-like beta-propeller repeat protein [Parabacteroides sp. PF5-6]MDF9829025.1 outer membrane protein assembly factor BamB [Parabacteroides sp. PF5-6]